MWLLSHLSCQKLLQTGPVIKASFGLGCCGRESCCCNSALLPGVFEVEAISFCWTAVGCDVVADPMTADADAGVASASSRTAVVAAASGEQRTAPNRHVGVPIVAVAGALARRCNGWTL
ncbi:hypothetical protein MLD38_032329 [Melastoma candidum]|uniref:Uncharacterized protein n=1 Tax=Melastoma candidum TaxID=119954 RepID=A0ACB9M3Q8_9MYRT|nr:hypothetical protein MLD38_032329 [Melastoma candidum]